MTDEDRYGGYTPRRATKFYIPLLLQAFSQSLTYPLVAAIVSHGKLGVDTLAAFAQGQTVMFMMGALGGGLVMTGMVFAKTLTGYRSFVKLNTWMTAVLLSVQILACLPPFHGWIFESLLNLPPHLALIARDTLFWCFIMQAGFFLRNIPLVVLFNARASFEANMATALRIALTALCPYFFIRYGLTGAMWGVVAITGPCMVELFLTWFFAWKYIREIYDANESAEDASVFEQFKFSFPISFGSGLLAMAPFMVAAFVGRSENPIAMLAIHYVTIGIANPVAYASLRMQAVAIQFPPEYSGDRRMIRFALAAGLCLGLIPLVIATPQVSSWYFNAVQNLPEKDIGIAQTVMCIYALWPMVQTMRGYAEGYSAWVKRPSAIMTGQIVHLAVLVATLAVSLCSGMAGWRMPVTAIFAANTSALIAIYLFHRVFAKRCLMP